LGSEPGIRTDHKGHAVIVSLECAGATSKALAELARAEAERYRARTHERRSAAVLWAALVTTPTPDAARLALAEFPDPRTVADAAGLLDRLTGRPCAVAWDGKRGTYTCGTCGAVARPRVANTDPMTRTRARRPMEHGWR
jgi:hypothetical protein